MTQAAMHPDPVTGSAAKSPVNDVGSGPKPAGRLGQAEAGTTGPDGSRTALVIADPVPATFPGRHGSGRGPHTRRLNRHMADNVERLNAAAGRARIPVFAAPGAVSPSATVPCLRAFDMVEPRHDVIPAPGQDLISQLRALGITRVAVAGRSCAPATLVLLHHLLDLCYDTAFVRIARAENDVRDADAGLAGVVDYLEVCDKVWCVDRTITHISRLRVVGSA